MSTAFDNLKQRVQSTNPDSIKAPEKVSAFNALKERQGVIKGVKEEKKPSKIGQFVKGLVSAPLTMVARPFQAVAELTGASSEDVDKFSSKISGGLIAPVPQNYGDVKKDVGRAAQTVALGAGPAAGGLAFGVGSSIEQGNNLLSPETALQGVLGVAGGKLLGLVGQPLLSATGKVIGKITPEIVKGVAQQGTKAVEQFASRHTILPEGVSKGINTIANTAENVVNKPFNVASKALEKSPKKLNSDIDKEILGVFKGTTMDIGKMKDSAFKARKGLDLLQKESSNIQIPDANAPLGSKGTKAFSISESSPNELLSGVLELDKKIVGNARKAVETAQKSGVKIDTLPEEKMVLNAIKNGDVPKATGERLLKQIRSTKKDPLSVHDWVQDVNIKYGKKYQRGTIDDTATGKLADDVAEAFRKKLDKIVDRKGYAEAFGNNQELKRLLVASAKKANKGVNFGDISTDAGLDAAISILTGNPVYMARTVGTSLFSNLFRKYQNTAGIRSIKKASEMLGKLPTTSKLPAQSVKPTRVKDFPTIKQPLGFE